MKKLYHILLIAIATSTLISCQKGEIIGGKTQNASLITGKWLVYQQNTKVFDLNDNSLLKDTILLYSNTNFSQAWYQIYNNDGTAYVTTTPYKKTGSSVMTVDTTSYLHYTIMGSSFLKLTKNGGGIETDPILSLTQSDLKLESKYTATPATGWGLDANTNYLFVVDTYYAKQ
jgi:hypothetical protein